MQTGSVATAQGLRTYYLQVATETVSQLGSNISVFAVGIAVFTRTSAGDAGSPSSPSAMMLPWIDRRGVRRGAGRPSTTAVWLLILANTGFVATSGLLLASFASGAFQLWHLYALALVTWSISTVSRPAFGASVAMLVPESHRDRAPIANSQMTAAGSQRRSRRRWPACSTRWSAPGAILIDIATFGLAIAVLLAVRIPMPAKTAEGAAMARAVRPPGDRRRRSRSLAAAASCWGCLVVSVVSFLMSGLSALILPYRWRARIRRWRTASCRPAQTSARSRAAAAMAAWAAAPAAGRTR